MRARCLAALLLLASAAAGAEPSPKVTLRIAPDVETRYPQLRSQIAASGVAEVAEPADLLLTTGDELDDYAELDPVGGSKFNVVRLGKFASGEAQAALPRVLAILQRQKMLTGLPGISPAVGVEACKDYSRTATRCEPASAYSPTTIRNRSAQSKYVAVVTTSADLGTVVVPFDDSKNVVRLDPGAQISAPPPNTGAEGISIETVLVSDRPFDPSPFAQQKSLGSTPSCFVRLYPECVATASPLPSTDNIQAIGLPYTDWDRAWDDDKSPPPAMGGGMPVARGSAEWMVELYATHDYTAQQIADDRKLPLAQQQFLWKRTPEELAHTCGGTMIGRDLVLTAAHCVATGIFAPPNEKRVFDARRVRVGSLLLGKGGETRAIVGMVVHEDYTGVGAGLPNDIALLLLKSDEPVRLGVPSLKVTSAGPTPGSTLAGLGWGFTHSVAADGNINLATGNLIQRNPSLLQMAPLQVISAIDCKKRFQDKLKPGMLCLVTPRSLLARGGAETFSCRGDSGGPLVRDYMSGRDELVGLTSWSIGCGAKDTPSVYTDVAYFSAWVDAARKAIKPGQVIRIGDPPRSH